MQGIPYQNFVNMKKSSDNGIFATGMMPPLPTPIEVSTDNAETTRGVKDGTALSHLGLPLIAIKSLKAGCYLMNYTPISGVLTTFDGTIRV